MDFDSIVYLLMVVASLALFERMVMWDSKALQINSFSNPRYREWLQKTDEWTSLKRLTPIAVIFLMLGIAKWGTLVALIAVVAIVAVVVTLFRSAPAGAGKLAGRVSKLYSVTILVALIPLSIGNFLMMRNSMPALDILFYLVIALQLLSLASPWLVQGVNKL